MTHSVESECLDEIMSGHDCRILQQSYRPRLLWFARTMGVPTQDCADVAQEVLLIAIRDIRTGKFKGDSSLITWLDGILKHKVIDLWRIQMRQRDLFLSAEPVAGEDDAQQETTSNPSPRWDRDIDVRRALDRMPDDLRAILLLNEAEGLTLHEIADRWRRPQGTLGRKLAEAKRVFRLQLVGIRRKRPATCAKPRAMAAQAG
jgi:RNA polymerase sigma factor (sigma-70 family)